MSNLPPLVLNTEIFNPLANRVRHGVFADSGFVTESDQQNLLSTQNLSIFTRAADCRMTAIPIQSGMPDAPDSLEERIGISLLGLILAVSDSFWGRNDCFQRPFELPSLPCGD
jgi:hypothetical protein